MKEAETEWFTGLEEKECEDPHPPVTKVPSDARIRDNNSLHMPSQITDTAMGFPFHPAS